MGAPGVVRTPSPLLLRTTRRPPCASGSAYGFRFSVPGQVECLGPVERGLVQRQLMHRCPQAQDVALGTAGRVETLENVLAPVGRKGRRRVVGLSVDRARPAALQATAAELVEQPQVTQDLCHADLLAEEGEVHLGTSGTVGQRRLDGRRRRYGSSGETPIQTAKGRIVDEGGAGGVPEISVPPVVAFA